MFLKKPNHARDKKQRQAEKEAQKRDAYKAVSRRDQYRCRLCGGKEGVHHHHLSFRSRGGQDTTANLVLLCCEHHFDVHAYRLAIVGTNANKTLKFVRRSA